LGSKKKIKRLKKGLSKVGQKRGASTEKGEVEEPDTFLVLQKARKSRGKNLWKKRKTKERLSRKPSEKPLYLPKETEKWKEGLPEEDLERRKNI